MRTNYIIGIVGVGNMGEALVRGLIRSQLVRPYEILASRRSPKNRHMLEKTYGIHCTNSNEEVIKSCPTVILAVKPQNMNDVLTEVGGFVSDSQIIISIAAGVEVASLRKILGKKPHLLRAMPNLPVVIDEGVTAIYCNKSVPERHRRFTHQIFQAVGATYDVNTEKLMDVVTAVSGTGPAYFFAMMEAMRDKAKAMGFPANLANELSRKTAVGAALLALQTNKSFEELRAQVTSKQGTTWAAMRVFKKQKFWKIVSDGIAAAIARAIELRKGK